MNAAQPLNMVQLTMREGTLSLRGPMQQAPVLDPEFVTKLKAFLVTEGAEKILFSTKDPNQDIKAEVSESGLRWLEKSPYGTQTFAFSFETKLLMYNNQPATSSFFVAFAKKLEGFSRDLQQDKIRILVKPKG